VRAIHLKNFDMTEILAERQSGREFQAPSRGRIRLFGRVFNERYAEAQTAESAPVPARQQRSFGGTRGSNHHGRSRDNLSAQLLTN
jgi:hypothetical protein